MPAPRYSDALCGDLKADRPGVGGVQTAITGDSRVPQAGSGDPAKSGESAFY